MYTAQQPSPRLITPPWPITPLYTLNRFCAHWCARFDPSETTRLTPQALESLATVHANWDSRTDTCFSIKQAISVRKSYAHVSWFSLLRAECMFELARARGFRIELHTHTHTCMSARNVWHAKVQFVNEICMQSTLVWWQMKVYWQNVRLKWKMGAKSGAVPWKMPKTQPAVYLCVSANFWATFSWHNWCVHTVLLSKRLINTQTHTHSWLTGWLGWLTGWLVGKKKYIAPCREMITMMMLN